MGFDCSALVCRISNIDLNKCREQKYIFSLILRSKISLVGRSSNGLRVVVGTLSLTTGGIAHTSAKHESHPDFNSSSSSNDVGLVKTVTTIVFNAVSQPILLGDQKLRGGENALFSGWVSERVAVVIALFTRANKC